LLNGESISLDDQLAMLNLHLATDAATSKGFVLDFPIYENENKTYQWDEKLIGGAI